jgi:RNA polymerase sigma-70 factor (ECF subfamily)
MMMPMNDEPVSSLHTRPSLLRRIRVWDDNASWGEFHRLYRKLIYSLGRRSGLTHADAEDVAQEVFTRVAETIDTFESDPSRGSFRGWLMNLTRWKIANKFARRPKDSGAAGNAEVGGDPDSPTIERVPDEAQTEKIWEEEWQQHVLEAAYERVARAASSRHYQVFDLYVRQHWPVKDVARELGISSASVYVIGHRLTRQLKAEVAKLRGKLG